VDSLSSWLARHGSLEPGDAVGWVIRAARSLETLHLQGKVHGAFSADALHLAGASPSHPGELRRPEARPEYTSPERLKTGRPSAADDAWALALMLYVALTSYHPFEGEDEDDTLDKIRSGPVPPLAVEPFRRALEGWASLPDELPPSTALRSCSPLAQPSLATPRCSPR
jgi:hypothetical protein